MKLSSAALLLAFISSPAAASPVKSRQATNPSFFTITAARSGSAIHQQSVHASSRAFWIGKPTETYCPPQVDAEAACPPGTETVLAAGDTAASLDVSVPGGQQIYVESTGALGFTQAHSAEYPPGSILQGFTLTPGSPSRSLSFSGLGATGFLACPANASGAGPYKVFANVRGLKDGNTPGGSVQACIGFDALAVEYADERGAAWQYI
ncbi:hypothetical protein MMC07_000021 [Pseudocyphellaria aurata]|nr:hypothetical protein [Pseudocyphellaria aurata]